MPGHISLTISGLSGTELQGLMTSLAAMNIGTVGVAPVNFGQAGIPADLPLSGRPGGQQAPAMPPAPRPTALPPMPGNGAPPPPPVPTAAPVSNPRLESVVKLMDAYSKGGNPQNGVAGVRKVLDVVGLKRAQDADEAQLVWLEQAFANTSWTPG